MEMQLIYDVVLISAVQQSDSVIGTLSCSFFRYALENRGFKKKIIKMIQGCLLWLSG